MSVNEIPQNPALEDLPENLITDEAANVLRVSKALLRKWSHLGGPITPIRFMKGGPLRWRKRDIIALLKEGVQS